MNTTQYHPGDTVRFFFLLQILKVIILDNFISILCSLSLRTLPIKAGLCFFRFTQGLRWTHISLVSEGAASDIYTPPVLAAHLHTTKCIYQIRPHYSSKEQMMAMILELCRYTYQADRNSPFVVPFPPTSIHTGVLTPTLSSQVKGTKVRVTPSARRLYWDLDHSPPGDGHSLSWTLL
jgi:hypothetical protein